MILGRRRNEVLAVVEVAALMNISTASVEALTRAGELPAVVARDGRPGVTLSDLKAYLGFTRRHLTWLRAYAPRVLVADQDPVITFAVDCGLRDAGVTEVVQATAASEVKHLMDETPFDLVILNRWLADALGGETARWIRVERADWRVSIVMMSGAGGFAEEYQREHSRFADGCLLKPFDVIDLKLCILRLRPWHRVWKTVGPESVGEERRVSSFSRARRNAKRV
jgi:CheY-like chemotaxis protein